MGSPDLPPFQLLEFLAGVTAMSATPDQQLQPKGSHRLILQPLCLPYRPNQAIYMLEYLSIGHFLYPKHLMFLRRNYVPFT